VNPPTRFSDKSLPSGTRQYKGIYNINTSMSRTFFYDSSAHVGLDLLLVESSRSHSPLHLLGLLWTCDQSDAETFPDNTQHAQETDIHDAEGIRTRNPRKRTTADLRRWPRGRRLRRSHMYGVKTHKIYGTRFKMCLVYCSNTLHPPTHDTFIHATGTSSTWIEKAKLGCLYTYNHIVNYGTSVNFN
jgi:hypothetical protein